MCKEKKERKNKHRVSAQLMAASYLVLCLSVGTFIKWKLLKPIDRAHSWCYTEKMVLKMQPLFVLYKFYDERHGVAVYHNTDAYIAFERWIIDFGSGVKATWELH